MDTSIQDTIVDRLRRHGRTPAMATDKKATTAEPARTAKAKGSRSRVRCCRPVLASRSIAAGDGAKVNPRQTIGAVPDDGDGLPATTELVGEIGR
jgi:hypothetical protein